MSSAKKLREYFEKEDGYVCPGVYCYYEALIITLKALETIKRVDYINYFEDGEFVKAMYACDIAEEAISAIHKL